MVSPIAAHIDAIKQIVAGLDDESFELLKAGVAYRLGGVPAENDPEIILMMQDALQMVVEFPLEASLYQLAVVIEDEERERAGY